MAQESGGNPNVKDGLMQVEGSGHPSPEESIKSGTAILGRLWRKYGGNVNLVLAAYNMGEGAIDWGIQHFGQDTWKPQYMQQISRHFGDGGTYGDPNYVAHVRRYM
jgi:hypothetical protein